MPEENIYRTLIDANLEENKKDHEAHVGKIRCLLKDIKEKTGASLDEIVDGLGFSKPVVTNFISNEGKGKSDKIPFERFNIITLWEILTDKEIYEKRKRKSLLRNKHIEARAKLRKEGCNNLLLAAGFKPRGSIEIGNLTEEDIKKSFKLISLLSSYDFSNELIWKIEDFAFRQLLCDVIQQPNNNSTQIEPSKIKERTKLTKTQEDAILILKKRYKKNDILKLDQENFLSSIKKYFYFGKQKFSEVEILELFHSIEENNHNRERLIDRGFRISVVSYEVTTLNSHYRHLQEYTRNIDDNYTKDSISKILNKVNSIGKEVEDYFCFGKIDINQEAIDKIKSIEEDYFMSSMKEIKLNCRTKNRRVFSWIYRSNQTPIQNTINAVIISLGIKSSLKDISIETLSTGGDSLVKVSCILEFEKDKSLYRGTWVGIDVLICVAQSLICATEQWIDRQEFRINLIDIYPELSSIYQLIDNTREAFYENRTKKNIKRIFDSSRTMELEKEAIGNPIDNKFYLENIVKDLQKKIEQVDSLINDNYKIKHNFPYIDDFVKYAKEYLAIFISCFEYNEDEYRLSKVTHIPIDLMYVTKEIINKFLRGDFELIENRSWHLEGNKYNLEKNKVIINKYLEAHIFGIAYTSLYYSWSEFQGNLSKLDFYFSRPRDRKTFETSVEGFLIAAYFSLKNDNGSRFSYWMCYAARSASRLGKFDDADAMLTIAKYIFEFSSQHQYNWQHKEGIIAICYLAESEVVFFKYYYNKNNNASEYKDEGNWKKIVEAFKDLLRALIEFHTTGLDWLMYDSLYNIYRYCLIFKEMPDEYLETLIGQQKFNDIIGKVDDKITDDTKFIKEITENISELNIADINSIKTSLDKLENQARDSVYKQWKKWFKKNESDYNSQKHPICKMIDDGEFLRDFFP